MSLAISLVSQFAMVISYKSNRYYSRYIEVKQDKINVSELCMKKDTCKAVFGK